MKLTVGEAVAASAGDGVVTSVAAVVGAEGDVVAAAVVVGDASAVAIWEAERPEAAAAATAIGSAVKVGIASGDAVSDGAAGVTAGLTNDVDAVMLVSDDISVGDGIDASSGETDGVCIVTGGEATVTDDTCAPAVAGRGTATAGGVGADCGDASAEADSGGGVDGQHARKLPTEQVMLPEPVVQVEAAS